VPIPHIGIGVSLVVIIGTLAVTTVTSLLATNKETAGVE
jgi:hypothetical protein